MFTRLTNAFSKELGIHTYAGAPHFAYFNFCRLYLALTKARSGVKTTLAMAAGLTDHVWTIEDLLMLPRQDSN